MIKLLNPTTGQFDTIEISPAMEAHRAIPINHFNTILEQINGGMYQRWFAGKKHLTCIDFGANVGLVSRYMIQACKRIVCVEPTPKHFELLEELLLNSMCDCDVTCTINPLAESIKDVIFMTGHSTENKITSQDGYGNGKITIEAKPLQHFIERAGGKVDFCKVDIEGYENKALTQEQLNYAAGKVKVFFVELHPGYNLGFAEIEKELTAKFKKAGYGVEMLDEQTLIATWK